MFDNLSYNIACVLHTTQYKSLCGVSKKILRNLAEVVDLGAGWVKAAGWIPKYTAVHPRCYVWFTSEPTLTTFKAMSVKTEEHKPCAVQVPKFRMKLFINHLFISVCWSSWMGVFLHRNGFSVRADTTWTCMGLEGNKKWWVCFDSVKSWDTP